MSLTSSLSWLKCRVYTDLALVAKERAWEQSPALYNTSETLW